MDPCKEQMHFEKQSYQHFTLRFWNLQTITRREVNFEVAPKEDKSTYPIMNDGHRNNERRQTQQKKTLGTNVNTIPMIEQTSRRYQQSRFEPPTDYP